MTNGPHDLHKFLREAFLDRVRKSIADYGWHNTHVGADEEGVGFSYSTGFTARGWPELIVTGLFPEANHSIMWIVWEQLEKGRQLPTNTVIRDIVPPEALADGVDPLNQPPLVFLEVIDPMSEAFPMSITAQIYPEFRAVQLVWPDDNRRFPWHHDYDQTFPQPLLGIYTGSE